MNYLCTLYKPNQHEIPVTKNSIASRTSDWVFEPSSWVMMGTAFWSWVANARDSYTGKERINIYDNLSHIRN